MTRQVGTAQKEGDPIIPSPHPALEQKKRHPHGCRIALSEQLNQLRAFRPMLRRRTGMPLTVPVSAAVPGPAPPIPTAVTAVIGVMTVPTATVASANHDSRAVTVIRRPVGDGRIAIRCWRRITDHRRRNDGRRRVNRAPDADGDSRARTADG